MGSKVFVTYKRKRLFSRSDHPLINLNSDTCSESAKSKNSDSFAKQEGLIAKCTLQNDDNGFGICNAYSKVNIRENARQSESHNSTWCNQCSEKHALKPKMLYSACSEHKMSPASDETQKFTPEQKCSQKSDVEQIISHPNVILDGSPEVGHKIDSAGLSNDEENIVSTQSKLSFAKSGSEYDENCKKILMVPQPLEACSDAEPDKLNIDQCKTLRNNSGIKCKLGSALITFCRRSKRNKADNASKSETVTAKNCLVDLNEKVELSNSVAGYPEKDISKDIDKSHSFSAPAPATSTAVLADDPHHFLRREVEDALNAAAQKVCVDVQDSDNINATTQRPSNQDVNSRRNHSPDRDSFVPPRASRNFDCNVPPDGASDENQPIEKSEVVHNSSMMAVSDKGKRVLNSPPVLTHNSSKNTYFQFLPESKSDSMLNLSNNSEKTSRLVPSIGLSLQPEQIIDGRARFPPSYEWPNFQPQPRESLLGLHLSTSDRTQSFSREKVMLDNILTRARAVRGNRTSFLDKFEYPTTWLEEELDSLWIGVRRHGRGNWDAILGDRRLHFLPWKSPWDLAERWQVEQSRLLCSGPVSQRRYVSPPDFSSEHDEVQLSLGQSHPLLKGFPFHVKNDTIKKDLQRNCLGLYVASELRDESSSTAALINGSLPHWLRTAAAVEIPRFVPTRREAEPHKGGTVAYADFMDRGKARMEECPPNKDSIVILSDASSEETISDDRSRLS